VVRPLDVPQLSREAGPGLLPGDNSSVRFDGIAAVLPPVIALLLMFWPR
jgi:hypothetical protein